MKTLVFTLSLLVASPTFLHAGNNSYQDSLNAKLSKGGTLFNRLGRKNLSEQRTEVLKGKLQRVLDQIDRKQCKIAQGKGFNVEIITADEGEGLVDDKLERSRRCRIGFEIITCRTNPYSGISTITDTETGDSVDVYHPRWWHRLFCFCCGIDGAEISTLDGGTAPEVRGWGGKGNVPITH